MREYLNMHLVVRGGVILGLVLLAVFFGWLSDLAEVAHLEATGDKYADSAIDIIMFLSAIGSLVIAVFVGFFSFFDWSEGKLRDD